MRGSTSDGNLANVKHAAEDLLRLQSSLLPARGLRLLGCLAIGVVFTLVISPLGLVWLLLPFAMVVILASLWISARDRARGLRGNHHAPMRPDDVTSVLEGGNVPLPGRWWTRWDQWLPLVTVAAAFLFSNITAMVDSTALGWTLAVAFGVLVAAGAAWWWIIASGRPSGQPPFAALAERAPQWTPTDDAEAVAALLYVVNACPRGRQIRQDALTITAAGVFGLDESDVSDALTELGARREVLVTTERDRSNVRRDWMSLTPTGIDSVVARFLRDAAHA